MRSMQHTYVFGDKKIQAGADITNKGEFSAAVGIDDEIIFLSSYKELDLLYNAINDLRNNINKNEEE